ncbi:ABC transporter substrate-binding protein [Streptomyces sp. NPDC055037]
MPRATCIPTPREAPAVPVRRSSGPAARPRRRAGRLRTLITTGTAAGALALAGCAPGDPASAVGGSGTFTLAVPTDLPSFDPYASNAGTSQMAQLAYLAYDSLVNQNDDGSFATGLAESWEVGPTATTFRLRDGVTCSDGTKLTAGQVAAALNYVGDPKNLTPFIGTMTPSVPYRVTGDDSTGEVKVTTASAYGFVMETLGNIPIVCGKGLANRSALAERTSGTGPFVLKSSTQTSYTFTVRKGYHWGPDGAGTSAPGTPDTLVLSEVPNFTTAASQLLAGQLSAARMNGPDAQRLTAARLPLSAVPYQKAALGFNERPDRITSDVRVRRALAAAVDSASIAKVLDGKPAQGVRAGTPLPCSGADARTALPAFDPEEAGRILDDAGWKRGGGGIRQRDGKKLSITVYFASDDAVLELIQQYWKEIGVEAKLHRATPQEAQDMYAKGTGDFDASYGGYLLPLPSAFASYVSGPLPPKGMNFLGVTNDEYDREAARASALAGDKACPLWEKAETALMRRVDFLPLADANVQLFSGRNAKADANSLRIPVPTSLRLVK